MRARAIQIACCHCLIQRCRIHSLPWSSARNSPRSRTFACCQNASASSGAVARPAWEIKSSKASASTHRRDCSASLRMVFWLRCSRSSSPLAVRRTLRSTLLAERRDSRALSSSVSGHSTPASWLLEACRPGAHSNTLNRVRADVRPFHTSSVVKGGTCQASRKAPKVYTRSSGAWASRLLDTSTALLVWLMTGLFTNISVLDARLHSWGGRKERHRTSGKNLQLVSHIDMPLKL